MTAVTTGGDVYLLAIIGAKSKTLSVELPFPTNRKIPVTRHFEAIRTRQWVQVVGAGGAALTA